MKKSHGHLVGVRGFFLVQLVENDKIVHDSGWRENQITNGGILEFLVKALLPLETGKKVGWMSLGTGAGPAAGDTALASEVTTRSVVVGTAVGSNVARFRASFPPAYALASFPITLSNVGLFDSGTVSGSTIFSGGNITPTENWVSNQTVVVTYEIEFTSV